MLSKKVLTIPGNGNEYVCSECISDFVDINDLTYTTCYICAAPAISSVGWTSVYPQAKVMVPNLDSGKLEPKVVTLCQHCTSSHFVCPCGLLKSSTDQFGSCTPTILPEDTSITVDSCCAECLGNVTESEDGQMVAYFQPFNEEYVKVAIDQKIYNLNAKITGVNFKSNDEPF
jgi:hypothetical protein